VECYNIILNHYTNVESKDNKANKFLYKITNILLFSLIKMTHFYIYHLQENKSYRDSK